jgi:hypothetical protein
MPTITLKTKNGGEKEVSASTLQAPAALHGQHALNGVQMIASPVVAIDPRTGAPFIQPGLQGKTMISPPPSRRFDGR